jgi:hypothetical protein
VIVIAIAIVIANRTNHRPTHLHVTTGTIHAAATAD